MKNIIFVFGTPESGSEKVLNLLEKENGYKIFKDNGDTNNRIWNTKNKLRDEFGGKCEHLFTEILEKIIFNYSPEKWAINCDTIGQHDKYGLDLFIHIYDCVDFAKIIFCMPNLDEILQKVVDNRNKWVPYYGLSLSECEEKINIQRNQFETFYNFFNDKAIILKDADNIDIDKLKSFCEL